MDLLADDDVVARVVSDCEMTIHSSPEDESGEVKVFVAGTVLEFFVVDHPMVNGKESTELANIQFPDGSMAFGVSGSWFKPADTLMVGDAVVTKVQLHFLEARNPETGETIETKLPRRHHLKVCGVDEKEGTVDVNLPDGFIATIPREDVE